MQFGITSKLFSAILVTNVVMAVAFGVAMQLSVNRGFRDYVEEREQRRLEALAQTLAAAYAEHGSWDFLRNDETRWQALTRPYRFEGPGPRRGFGPPPGDSGPDRERMPPREGSLPPGAFPPPPFAAGSIALVDARKEPVAGAPGSRAKAVLSQPVVVDGTTVGSLVLGDLPYAGADTRFVEQMLATGWLVAGIALLIAVAAAIPLARGLLAPIRRIALATHRVAAGDYSQTIAPTSGDELGQLVFDFNRLTATLKEAESARRGFLADVSHELRTPLAVLRAELEALQDGVRAWTPEAAKSLQAEVATLAGLVDDLYDLAVADLGPQAYRDEKVDVAALAADAVAAFTERFAGHGLVLDASGIAGVPATVRGDARRLTQLFNNLLENALRYTDSGGRVEIAVRGDADGAEIDVRDSAPGVPPHLLPRLFERMFRVEPSRSREFGGAGLGLSLCDSIVRAHGGTIEAKTSPLGGLWIHVRLPRRPEASVRS